MAKNVDLRFEPDRKQTGFTPYKISDFSNLHPGIVVRELIQNSLDAAIAAEEETAIIHFRLDEEEKTEIPGINSYEEHFKKAVEYHKKEHQDEFPDAGKQIVQTIDEALKQEKNEVLSVLDNGIGLNEERMLALLSDGISQKANTATGSFGNGHFAIIPVSDFHYVLYGGLTKNGTKIAAGHAVLASRYDPHQDDQISGEGLLIHDFSKRGKHEYAKNHSIPEFISKRLDFIQKKFGHGAAIIIPAFNNFRERQKGKNKSLRDIVLRAAACNFFQAIEEGKLQVKFSDHRPGQDNKEYSLEHSTLEEVLNQYKEEKRSRDSLLIGYRACQAYDTLKKGESYNVSTKIGDVRIQLLVEDSKDRRIDICRNGMWITDDKHISSLRYQLNAKKPFHALLLLKSSEDKNDFHNLVRKAEGPKHNDIEFKHLRDKDRKSLKEAFKEVLEWLQNNIEEISSDPYSPDDYLSLDFGEDSGSGKGDKHFGLVGTPTPVFGRGKNLSHTKKGTGEGLKSGKKQGIGSSGGRSSQSKPLHEFGHAVSVPSGPNRRLIHIDFQEEFKNIELRLRMDENEDATCDSVSSDEISKIYLQDVILNGKNVEKDQLLREQDNTVGVRLGDVTAEKDIELEVSYIFAQGIVTSVNQEPVFRIELSKGRDPKNSEKT